MSDRSQKTTTLLALWWKWCRKIQSSEHVEAGKIDLWFKSLTYYIINRRAKMSDRFQEIIDDFKIPNSVNENYRIFLLHYLSGTKDNPYRFRRSKVFVRGSSYFGQLSSDEEKHQQVLNEYIQYLDRNETFLKLVVDKFIKRLGKDRKHHSLNGEIKFTDKNNEPFYKVKCSLPGEPFKIEWLINEKTVEILAPTQEMQSLFEKLYEDKEVPQEWYLNLALLRAHLFSKVCESNSELKHQRKVWKELSSFQSGLIYFFTALSNETNLRSLSIIVQRSPETLSNNYSELAVAIIAPAIVEMDTNDVIKKINELFDKFHNAYKETSKTMIKRCLVELGINTKLANKIENKIKKNLYYLKFKNSISTIDWMIMLTSHLVSQKHEGKLLDFFLVYGELSEFKDIKTFRLLDRAQNLTDLDSFNHSLSQEGIEELARSTVTQISREHYSWFENGRHALFWNSASDDDAPAGLVSIKNGSWIQLIQDRFRDELPFYVPNCLVCYVHGEAQRTGALIVNNNKVEELLIWNNNKWNLWNRASKRQEELEEVLKILNITEKTNETTLSQTVKIALRIADDPKRGGTIAFMTNEPMIRDFIVMGKPWKLKDKPTEEDLIALISQDGATIRLLDKHDWDAWYHRNLLIPDGRSLDLFKQIERVVKPRHQRKWPLIAKGARRWNAAIMACSVDIDAVMVISQDGDIQVWYVKNYNHQIEDVVVRVIEFPLQGGHEEIVRYPKSEAPLEELLK